MEQTIFKVVQGIRGNGWNSKEGVTVSRAFHIKSVNVTSLASAWREKREIVERAKKECERGRVGRGRAKVGE